MEYKEGSDVNAKMISRTSLSQRIDDECDSDNGEEEDIKNSQSKYNNFFGFLDNFYESYNSEQQCAFEQSANNIRFFKTTEKFPIEIENTIIEKEFDAFVLNSLRENIKNVNSDANAKWKIKGLLYALNFIMSKSDEICEKLVRGGILEDLEQVLQIRDFRDGAYVLSIYGNMLLHTVWGTLNKDIFEFRKNEKYIRDIIPGADDNTIIWILHYINSCLEKFNVGDEYREIFEIIIFFVHETNEYILWNFCSAFVKLFRVNTQDKIKECSKEIDGHYVIDTVLHYFANSKDVEMRIVSMKVLEVLEQGMLSKEYEDIIIGICIDELNSDKAQDDDLKVEEAYFIMFYLRSLDGAKVNSALEEGKIDAFIDIFGHTTIKAKLIIGAGIIEFISGLSDQILDGFINETFFQFVEECISYESPELIKLLINMLTRMFSYVTIAYGSCDSVLDAFSDRSIFYEFFEKALEAENIDVKASADFLATLVEIPEDEDDD